MSGEPWELQTRSVSDQTPGTPRPGVGVGAGHGRVTEQPVQISAFQFLPSFYLLHRTHETRGRSRGHRCTFTRAHVPWHTSLSLASARPETPPVPPAQAGVARTGREAGGGPPAPLLRSSLPPPTGTLFIQNLRSPGPPASPPPPRPCPSRLYPEPFKWVITHYYRESPLYWGRRGRQPGERSGRRGGGGERGRERESEGECEREQSLPLPEEGSD